MILFSNQDRNSFCNKLGKFVGPSFLLFLTFRFSSQKGTSWAIRLKKIKQKPKWLKFGGQGHLG